MVWVRGRDATRRPAGCSCKPTPGQLLQAFASRLASHRLPPPPYKGIRASLRAVSASLLPAPRPRGCMHGACLTTVASPIALGLPARLLTWANDLTRPAPPWAAKARITPSHVTRGAGRGRVSGRGRESGSRKARRHEGLGRGAARNAHTRGPCPGVLTPCPAPPRHRSRNLSARQRAFCAPARRPGLPCRCLPAPPSIAAGHRTGIAPRRETAMRRGARPSPHSAPPRRQPAATAPH